MGEFSYRLNAATTDFVETIKNGKSDNTTSFYAEVNGISNDVWPAGPKKTYKQISNVQGSDGAWKGDQYASDLVGHTLVASFLKDTQNEGTYEIDFTGTPEATKVGITDKHQQLLAEVVDLAPANLLRCKAQLVDKEGKPALSQISIFPAAGASAIVLKPADGVKRELAKIVLHGMGCYVVETYHSCSLVRICHDHLGLPFTAPQHPPQRHVRSPAHTGRHGDMGGDDLAAQRRSLFLQSRNVRLRNWLSAGAECEAGSILRRLPRPLHVPGTSRGSQAPEVVGRWGSPVRGPYQDVCTERGERSYT